MSAGLLRRVRRLLLPSFDLILLERLRLLGGIEPGSTVLDAGCGDGTAAGLLARRGHRVVAVSNEPDTVERLRAGAPDGVDFRVHDLARDGAIPEGFDAALCFDVLEHIRDDGAALAALAGSLRPGGRLLVTVPDRGAPPLWGDAVSGYEDGGHVRAGYTREELEEKLRAAGFRPLRAKGFAGFFAQKATNVSRRLEGQPGRLALLLRFLWLAAMRPLCLADRVLPWPSYGLFVLAERLVGGSA